MAIGYAIKSNLQLNSRLCHPRLEHIGKRVQVSQARGNLILGLKDSNNATRLLLQYLNESLESLDREIYVDVVDMGVFKVIGIFFVEMNVQEEIQLKVHWHWKLNLKFKWILGFSSWSCQRNRWKRVHLRMI